jgi:hypothetical protein
MPRWKPPDYYEGLCNMRRNRLCLPREPRGITARSRRDITVLKIRGAS